MLGARFVCSDVSPSCFGQIHATMYATPDARDRVTADVLEAFPDATSDEEGTITWHDTTIAIYEPESASDWFHANCALREGEHTIIDVGWVER